MKLFDKLYAYVWGSAFFNSSNTYLISDGGETVLIDPGTYKSYTNLFGLMRNDGIECVDYVLNTHLHKDHCETNSMFSGKGALLGFDERDLEVSLYNFKPDLKLGRVFMVGDTEIEVLRTPGHSPGSLSFFIHEYGAIISGDLVFEGGVPGRYDLYSSDRKEMIKSLEKIGSFEPEYILPGHRRILEGRKGIKAMLDYVVQLLDSDW